MKKLLLLVTMLCLTLFAQAQVSKTINIATAGTLSTALTADEKATITNLTLTGTIDARDFKTMRDDMPILAEIDMGAVNIAAYAADGEAANSIPYKAFYNGTNGKLTLKSFVFPASVTSIGDNAFEGCSGFTGSLTIPSSVTSIAYMAFNGCSGFTGSLTIPASVTSIGDAAFLRCSGFTGSLTIPFSVTSIGSRTFAYCSGFTGSLTIPSSVTSIGDDAFAGCSGFTGSLTIPSSVTSIGSSAFNGCGGFTGSLNIPSSVTSIGDGAFVSCGGIFNVDSNNLNFSSVDGVLYNKNKTTLIQCPISKTGRFVVIPSSVTSIGGRAFEGCSGFTGSLTIPSSVTSIGNQAFYGCSGFKGSLTIPSSVVSIGGWAFAKCSGFTGSLIIPSSVTSIGEWAFWWCSGFTGALTIPSSVTSIGGVAFYKCSSLSSIIAYSSTPIDVSNSSNVFDNVTKTKLYVPIGSKAAYQVADRWKDFINIIELDLTKVNLSPGKLSTTFTATELAMISAIAPTGDIDARDFKTMRDDMPMLRIIDLSNANIVEYTGMLGTFGNDIITYSANKIPAYAFYDGTSSGVDSVLTSTILPASITVIGTSAFQNCTSLSTITIPANVNTIDQYAFYNCKGLQEVTVSQSTPIDLTNSSSVFFGVDKTTCMLNVPDGTLAKYKIANQWKDFTTIIEPSFITLGKIASTYTPTELASMTTLTLEGNIDARDFKTMRDDMPKLTSIDLSNATIVEYMGMLGTLSEEITTYSANQIPADAFFNAELNMGKSELSSVILPTTITSIDSSAFNGCSGLTTVSIPTSVTSLGTKAFANCLGLQKIYVYETTPLDLTNSATVFAGVNKRTCELHIPDGTLAIYRAANQWGEFIKLRESDTALKTMEDVSVTVFPNPVKENFRVTGLDGVFTVTLLDITGNTVLTQEASANESISMSSFPAGSYLLLIKTERGTICKMITKR